MGNPSNGIDIVCPSPFRKEWIAATISFVFAFNISFCSPFALIIAAFISEAE